jgi:hypothetical protein
MAAPPVAARPPLRDADILPDVLERIARRHPEDA